MIQLKNKSQIAIMREAGRITGEALALAREAVKPGVSTKEIDTLIRHHIERSGAKPSFLGYGGFPASACISINEQVIHGIPSSKVILKEGDIVKIDVGAFYQGYHGDSAKTFAVGRVSEEAARLIDITEKCFWAGVEQIQPNARIGDIGHAIESLATAQGYGVVRRYVGHGVGQNLHESPDVPNYGTAGRGARVCPGMTIAVEPMICIGSGEVKELPDGWTVVTADNTLSAHYEHTVALTENGLEILTQVD